MSQSNEALDYLKPANDLSDYPVPMSLLGSSKKPEFPLHALPKVIRDAVLEVHRYVQAPIPLIASCVLGVIASVGQGLILVRRDSSLVSPVSLIILSIADPNERKSKIESYFKLPIVEWEKAQEKQYSIDLNNYLTAVDVFESVEANLLKAIKKDEGEDLEALHQSLATHRNENRPTPILRPSILQGDSTKEGSIKHLAESYPLVSVMSAEGGTIFGGAALSQANQLTGTLAFYDSLWSNEGCQVTRAGAGKTNLERVALTMNIAVQPDVFEKFITKADSIARGIGFLARACICHPASTQGERLYKPPPEVFGAVDELNGVVKVLLGLLPEHIEYGALRRKQVRLSAPAFTVWEQYYNSVELLQKKGQAFEFVRDVAGKSAENAARFAGLFHLVDTETPYLIGDEISEAHMGMGADIAAYYLDEAKAYLSSTDLPEDIRLASDVSSRLVAYCTERKNNPDMVKGRLFWNELTLRQFVRLGGAKLSKLPSKNPLIEELLSANHLIDKRQDAKNSTVLMVNPRLIEEA